MADNSGIEWLKIPGRKPTTWNPATGCFRVSDGCANCWARRFAFRLRGRFGYPETRPFVHTFHPDRLQQPFAWRGLRSVLVCSMGDLFLEGAPSFTVATKVFEVMAAVPQHTYFALTKRPENMQSFIEGYGYASMHPNIWLGVSVENQYCADNRISLLLETPATHRFISAEPLLGPLDITAFLGGLDWVIAGSESGPGARPMDEQWVRDLRDQCVKAGVPFFYKQKMQGSSKVSLPELDGRVWAEWPKDLAS